MRAYIIRRSLLMIPTLIIASFLTFLMLRMIPGDIVDQMVAEIPISQSPKVTEELREKFREDLGLVGNFIHSILSQEIIELYGDEKRTRYFIYVKDFVNQLLHLIPHVGDGFSAINIVGMRIPLKNILDTLIELTGQGSYRLLPFPDSIAQIEPGEGEISQERLRNHIGEPHYTQLTQALEETLHYFQRVIIL